MLNPGFENLLDKLPFNVLGATPVPGRSIEFINEPNSCCYETVANSVIGAIHGQRQKCATCSNTIKVVESEFPLLKTVHDEETGQARMTILEGYTVHAVSYLRACHSDQSIDSDLTVRGLRNDGLVRSRAIDVAYQVPAAWIESDSLRVVAGGRGIQMLLGKVKDECRGKRPTTDMLLFEKPESFGIERR